MTVYHSKSFVYHGAGDVRLETVDVSCGPTDLIVRVDICGRCGTDRKSFVSQHASVKPPIVLGHEFSGHIVQVGRDVEGLRRGLGERDGELLEARDVQFALGERITVQPKVCEYRTGLMLTGKPLQHMSFGLSGAMAQYLRIPAEMIQSGSVLRIPDSVSSEEAALVEPAACVLESIFATPHALDADIDGRHIVKNGIRAGGRTLIIGSGTLALIYAEFARLEGASEVHLIVRSEEKARAIRELLGDWPLFTVLPDYAERPLHEKASIERALVATLREKTQGQLFDDVVLAVPSLDAQRYAFELLQTTGHGVVALFAGLQKPPEGANVDLLHYRVAKAIGTTGCSTRTMRTVLRWLESGRLSLSKYCATRRYTLSDDPSEFFKTDAFGLKPMLYPWE